jgi:hypothetical protein
MAQQPAAPAANPAALPAFRIVINMDISGSMAPELAGVKAYCAELASLFADLEVPISMAIITFTEAPNTTCVSLHEFQVSLACCCNTPMLQPAAAAQPARWMCLT